MMRDKSVHVMSWGRVVLAILPGVCFILLQKRMDSFEQLSTMACALGIAVVIGASLVLISLFVDHSLAPWVFPVFGILAWVMWRWMQWQHYIRRNKLVEEPSRLDSFWNTFLYGDNGSFLQALVRYLVTAIIIIASFLILYRMLRQFRRLKPWLWYSFLCVLIVDIILPNQWILDLSALIIPVFFGLLWVERDGLAAGLFVAAFEPIWIELFLVPGSYISINSKWLDSIPQGLTYLSCFCFFVIVPAGLLRAHSQKAQLWWLVLPSFLALIAINMIQVFTLDITRPGYFPSSWLQRGSYSLQLYLPLLLCAVLYCRNNFRASPQKELKLGQSDTCGEQNQ